MSLDPSAAAIEREIDDACRAHPLLALPYSQAVTHLLTVADTEGAGEKLPINNQQRATALNLTMNALKYAVRWAALNSPPKDRSAPELTEINYRCASELLRQARNYLSVVAAFSWAHRDVVHLTARGQRLLMSFQRPLDDRFEAYDALLRPSVSPSRVLPEADLSPLQNQVSKCLAQNLTLQAIPTTRNVLSAGYRIASERTEPCYLMPAEWSFGDFTIRDYALFNNVIRGMVFGWHVVLDLAAGIEWNAPVAPPFTVQRGELVAAVRDLTGLPKAVVKRLADLLSYRRDQAASSDPVLQPLIAVSERDVLLSSRLVVDGAPERNLISLINTRERERSHYDRLKKEKETLMRERLEKAKPSRYKSWFGRLPAQKSDIDYALIDERTGSIIIAELKWFVEPDEPRELAHRSEEVRKGVNQCKAVREAIQANRSLLDVMTQDVRDVLCIVISANSIGMGHVQDADVPVINEVHFIEELAIARGLDEVIEWLRTRSYLPVEGRDYESLKPMVPFFSWELEWYGFRWLRNSNFLPLSNSASST